MDFSQRVDRPIPPDRVLTITNDEHVGAMGGRMDRSTSEDWRANDTAAVEALLTKHGPPPKGP